MAQDSTSLPDHLVDAKKGGKSKAFICYMVSRSIYLKMLLKCGVTGMEGEEQIVCNDTGKVTSGGPRSHGAQKPLLVPCFLLCFLGLNMLYCCPPEFLELPFAFEPRKYLLIHKLGVTKHLETLLLIVSCAFSVLCFVTDSDHH